MSPPNIQFDLSGKMPETQSGKRSSCLHGKKWGCMLTATRMLLVMKSYVCIPAATKILLKPFCKLEKFFAVITVIMAGRARKWNVSHNFQSSV